MKARTIKRGNIEYRIISVGGKGCTCHDHWAIEKRRTEYKEYIQPNDLLESNDEESIIMGIEILLNE